MPILSHDNKGTLMVEAFSEAIDRSNDFISILDGESTRRHEVILQVHNDERITMVHSDIFYEMQFTKLHERTTRLFPTWIQVTKRFVP